MLKNKNSIHLDLPSNKINNALGPKKIGAIIDYCSIKNFPADTLVIRQNDSIYLILLGKILIYTISSNKEIRVLDTLSIGQHFDEQTSLPSMSGTQSTYVKTICNSIFLKIPKSVFLQSTVSKKALLDSIISIGEQQLRHTLAKQTALFKLVKIDEYNTYHLGENIYSAGEIIFREGEIGQKFFLLLSGRVDIFKFEAGKEKRLNEIESGGYFGELALINNETRYASVRAKTEVHTLTLDKVNFRRLYNNSPELRSHFKHIEYIYQLPKSGSIAMHPCLFLDMDALCTVYHTQSGIELTVTKVSNKAIVQISRVSSFKYDNLETVVYGDDSMNIFRALELHYGVIVKATSYGNWDDLGYVLENTLNQVPLQKRQLSLFKLEGELRLVRSEIGVSDTTILCKCTNLSREHLKKCIASGCNTVSELSEETGASKVCGSCGPLLVELMEHTHLQRVILVESKIVSEHVKSFRFEPAQGKFCESIMGQHIFVEAEINGKWLRRAYTLTSPAIQNEHYEITVKKEDEGIFSTWLHDEATSKSTIRASIPNGGFEFNTIEKNIVFFVAGIGITPVINFMRSKGYYNDKNILLVISSDEHRNIAYIDELERLDNIFENINIQLYLSDAGIRLNEKAVIEISIKNPEADYFICGPNQYKNSIERYLLANRIPNKNLYTEDFSTNENATKNLPSIKGTTLLYFFSLLAIGIVSFILLAEPIAINTTVQGDRQLELQISDKILKQISGFTVIGIGFIGLLLSLRKRMKLFKMGRFAYWRVLHVFFGLIAISVLVLHTGFSLGNNLNNALIIAFTSVVILGVLSMLLKLIQNKIPNATLFLLQDNFNWLHIVISTLLPGLIIIHIAAGYYF